MIVDRRFHRIFGFAIVFGSCLALAVAAHDYHVSLTEIEYNAERGFLEIALRVLPEDLEAGLAKRSGRLLSLDSKEIEPQLIDYLKLHFVVEGPDGPLRLSWVGKEISHRAAWLYFEMEVEVDQNGKPPALTLANRLLFDLESSQQNHVLFRSGQIQTPWIFTIDSRPVPLPLHPID